MIDLIGIEEKAEQFRNEFDENNLLIFAQVAVTFKCRPSELADVADKKEAFAFDLTCRRVLLKKLKL